MAELEPSILRQIRKKEVELSVKADQARRDAEQIVTEAKQEAAATVSAAETEGRTAADESYKIALASVMDEVEKLKRLGEEEAKSARLRGERNLPRAIDRILKVVIPE
jgi:vacuolar-type H+-ATPase subunit H